MFLEAFTTHFSTLVDSRQSAKITYPMSDVLFITLCGVIAGAQGWSEIRDYAEGHHDWFKKHGFLLNGVPVDDTIARIISRIDPEQFGDCFINWMRCVYETTEGEVIAIDGKTLRSSYTRDDRQATIHMVNAFACANQVVLGQLKTDSKSNEIKAIPALIDLLDVQGTLVSIDAMGCQTEIADAILNKGGDYLLAVKGNQGNLHQAVVKAFEEIRQTPLGPIQLEKNKGRIEGRAFYTLPAQDIAARFPQWRALKTLCMALSFRQLPGKAPELTYRYYISSKALSEQALGHAVRNHWAIENQLHWVLDVSLHEDECQVNQNHGADNLSTIRHIALNMLRAEPTQGSIPKKQKRAWMKTSYLEAVLQAGLSEMFIN